MCVCADGGANQLYDELPKRLPAAEPDALRVQHAPDVITGECRRVLSLPDAGLERKSGVHSSQRHSSWEFTVGVTACRPGSTSAP